MQNTTGAQQNHNQAWLAWQDYSNGQRLDPSISMARILRQSHSNHFVTRIDSSSCDLEGYAAAGYASWTVENFDAYHAEREFSSPGPRVRKQDAGALNDTVHFGRARYEWHGKNFIVYTSMFVEHLLRGPQPVSFIVAPCGDKMVDGRHSDVEALLLACGRWTKELHEEMFVFDQAQWSKSKGLYNSVQSSSWDDVILDPNTKAKLLGDIQGFFDNQDIYRAFGVPWKRGVILHGLPGNGKTISIKALINTLSKRDPEPVPSLYVKSLDHCSGPKYSVQMIFSMARKMAPCVLIFEDLDSMVTEKVRSYFLNEVDGLESNDGILMIGSTNHLDSLDPAISKRPSRFDRKYHFKLPDEQERVMYCEYWRKKLEKQPIVAFPREMCPIIAKVTEEFSFAYLKELFITSLLLLARGGVPDDAEGQVPSDSSSNTDAVVVEADDKEAVDSKANADEESADKKKPKDKRKTKKAIPKVVVPDALQGNALLAIINSQAQALLGEMDNSEDRPVTKGNSFPEAGDFDSDCAC